jgi:adenosylmethionine---8-amino-7-oxononanoate aminotransferase
VCLANSYHGETIGALGVTDVALFKDAYDPLIRHAHVVTSPDARKGADAVQQALADMRALLEVRSQHLAAVIVEPLVQCAAGMAMHDPSYLPGLRTLCERACKSWGGSPRRPILLSARQPFCLEYADRCHNGGRKPCG